jgi:tetratricopeptide (TPR) repeat protein
MNHFETTSAAAPPPAARARLQPLLGVLALAALVLAVYYPLLPGVFLMDDHRLIADDNPLVNGQFTIFNIWFQTDFILSNLAFQAQWLLWGEHPGGYHAVNLALHALSAVLLWRVLRRLRVPGAWVAAAVFAVHPVAVTSVARIAELKNTLSLPFCLLSLWAWLRYQDQIAPAASSAPGRRSTGNTWYTLALLAFLLALFAKTSVVMLPPVLLFILLWRHGRITLAEVWRLVPFFVLALAFGILSAGFQKYQALADETLPAQSFAERLALAGRILWFYLGKDVCPLSLNAFYPLWPVTITSPLAYLPLLLFAAVLAVAWRFRQDWGRHVLFGLACFVAALFPVLGFFAGQYQTWLQVSDHLQYLPMLAPVALVVALLAGGLGPKTFRLVAVLLLAALTLLANQRARIFSHEETLMRDCLAKNPAAWGAENSLGTILAKRQDYPAAIAAFQTALTYQPADPITHMNLGHAQSLQGDFVGAETNFQAALARQPIDPETRRQYASDLALQGRNPEARRQWQIALALKSDVQTRLNYVGLLYQTGDNAQAITQLRRVVTEKPGLSQALNNLAWLLATCGDDRLRNGAEAVRDAEQACALTGYKQAGFLGTLAAAYAEAGRFPEAVSTCQRTIQQARAAGQTQFANINAQLLQLYHAGRPYHAGG